MPFRAIRSLPADVHKPLDHAQILEISGQDAVSFANAQFCSDVSALAELTWHWSAWLDPQGRARNVFALLRPSAQHLLIWLPLGSATEMAGQLSRFVFRSKVTLAVRDVFSLHQSDSLDSAPGQLVAVDDGWSLHLPGEPGRQALLSPSMPAVATDHEALNAWRLADIADGLPWIDEAVNANFTAPALGLDRLEAISTSKGCYPGQEIVARLHFRGGNKRACVAVRIDGERLPVPGESVHSIGSQAEVGKILYAARSQLHTCRALAVLPIDVPRGAGLALECGTPVAVESIETPTSR